MMNGRMYVLALTCATMIGSGAALAAGDPQSSSQMEVLHRAHIMLTKGAARPFGSNELSYQGGTNGVGVMGGATNVYLIYWGSQWNNNDPSGQAALQSSFFANVGGSSWNASVTQYCDSVAIGTVRCNGAGVAASNPVLGVYIWYDNGVAAPSHPSQSQLAAEAVRAAQFFGNTTQGLNANAQYVINTATGNNSRGFGTQYCAYHSWTSSAYGNIAYTNMPYITDAGASCGANFNGLGPRAGITVVGGHEFAETETDIYPSSGWLDRNGEENGDKCAWITSGQGAAASVSMGGQSFPVQSLWSNAFNNGAGGCVLSY